MFKNPYFGSLESNIWKFFLFSLSQRRNFMPILSIYFLTLPNTMANQIGFYTGIGALFSFFLEIPSGYFSDRFGHKNTLVLSKFFMCVSLCSYILGSFLNNPFIAFVIGSIFQFVGFAMSSGTASVFIHETLKKLGEVKNFSKIFGRIQGNVSFVSIFIIVALPFLTMINIIIPLFVALVLDILGFFIALSFVNPNLNEHVSKNLKLGHIREILNEFRSFEVLPLAIFFGAITGFSLSSGSFRGLYVESLGYPIIYLGFIMGLSRFIWWIFSRFIHKVEDLFSLKQFLKFEIFIFTLIYGLICYLENAYVVAFLFALVGGYMWGRSAITKKYLLDMIGGSRFKVTHLSICSQITSLFNFSVAFFIGFFMNFSYRFGFLVYTILLIFVLIVSYFFIKK